jgi:hypothetical protein
MNWPTMSQPIAQSHTSWTCPNHDTRALHFLAVAINKLSRAIRRANLWIASQVAPPNVFAKEATGMQTMAAKHQGFINNTLQVESSIPSGTELNDDANQRFRLYTKSIESLNKTNSTK